MKAKDIKSTSNDNTVKKFAVENPRWKSDMQLAVKLGYTVEPQNEEQTEYLNRIKAKLAEKEAKAKAKEEQKKSLLKKMSDAMKAKKAQLVSVANDLADRIICKAIEKEEQQKRFAEKDKELKAKADKQRKEKAEKKRERKAQLRNKTIPSPEAIAANKKQQDFLSKVHTTKREEIEKKLNAKIELFDMSREEWEAKRAEKKAKQQKAIEARWNSIKNKIQLKRTTKGQRIEAIKAKKATGKAAYEAELKRQADMIIADRAGYAARQEKKQKTEAERLAMIAEKRKARKNKLFAEKLKQIQKKASVIKHFLESEAARLARKEEKRAKYLTKGGTKVPKVKNKKEVDTARAKAYQEIAESKLKSNINRYIIHVATIDSNNIITDSIGAFNCTEKDLEKRMKTAHNNEMKRNPDNYIGIYAYSGIHKNQKCVKEMLNDKHKEGNSRVNNSAIAA